MVELVNCSPSEAQRQCHFVVFIPALVPKGLRLHEQYLRPESKVDRNRRENHRATFRQVFAGAHRALVMKQFLYDWAPPAYDHPCLWRNPAIATQTESPAPRGQLVGNSILWFGKNYRRQEAATIEIKRTRIEMTAEKGAFSDQEIVSLCESLVPADVGAAKQILDLSFSTLSYSHRHEEPVVSVPLGYWKHTRSEELISYALTQEEIPEEIVNTLQPLIIALTARGYTINGGFGFGKRRSHMEEIEIIFERQNAPGCFVRILCTRSNSTFSISVPPNLGDQECIHQTLCIQGNTLYYATSKNLALGSHEIVFSKDPFNFMMLVKPAPWTTFEWVMGLLDSFFGDS